MAFFRQGYGAPNLSPSPSLASDAVSSASSVSRPFPLRATNSYSAGNSNGGAAGDYSEELWQACAGPLVSVPQAGDLVWYFPQGHMEQVAASQGTPSQSFPNSALPSQILCSVVNRTLSAEPDTDEVFAKISLLPLAENTELPEKKEKPPQPKRSVRLFTKILTASDTSTHGGFSVLRRHAEECLPPLDMAQEPPSQDLVAKDLHNKEWSFKHTFRGHPRRHLLTTGWSVFVSSKKLLAGDAVIFLRGENGELRVGIRRAKRQQAAQPSVLTSHSMHMGVVATANYAIMTRTIFSVFYKPRVSASPFLVPVEKLAAAMARSVTVGYKFKMRFETDDASERSYSGTVVNIEDLDGAWPGSKWRSLKVTWDDVINNDRQDKISPWEIEPCATSPAINPSPPPRFTKRSRPSTLLSQSADLGVLGTTKGPLECSFAPLRVLQGQEWNMGVGSAWRNSSQSTIEAHHAQQQLPGLPLTSPRTAYYSPYTDSDYSKSSCSKLQSSNSHGHGFMIQGSSWSSNDNSNWLRPLRQPPSPSTPAGGGSVSPSLQVQQASITLNSTFPTWESQERSSTHVTVSPTAAAPPTPGPSSASVSPVPVSSGPPSTTEGTGCKLFGFSLTENPRVAATAVNKLPKNAPVVDEEEQHLKDEQQVSAHDDPSHLPKQNKVDVGIVDVEPDHNPPKEVESRNHSVRSCTKVMKEGSMVGRGVDLSKFDSYEKLLEELEAMFHMEGELTNPEKGWKVAYEDNEGDRMQVGDDPWREFCDMVRKIYIWSPEEVRKAGLAEGKTPGNTDEKLISREGAKSLEHEAPPLPV